MCHIFSLYNNYDPSTVGFVVNEGPTRLGREMVEFQRFQEFENFGAQYI